MKMTSPDGDSFTALWANSPRTASKKLGLFDYPQIAGTVVQDLDLTSMMWPLTFFIAGADHDIVCERFMKAVAQNGQWGITHPVYGFKGLQLISITEIVDPVESGNVREFNSEWIEPIDPNTLKTAAEMAGTIGVQADLFAISAADQFAAGLAALGALNSFSISAAIGKVNGAINSVLGPLTAATTAVQAEMLAIQRGIQDTLASAILNPLMLAGQLQALVTTPLKAINDIKSRLSNYADLASAMFDIQPASDGSATNPQGRNTALIQEVSLTSVISANATIAATSPEQGGTVSQSQAIQTAAQIKEQHRLITEKLEESQVIFNTAPIENQHISQQDSHYQAALITAQAIEFLYTSSFDLKKERRFTTDRVRAPVEIAIVEYGGPGENDENIDLFIESNKLKGNEILMLPAGREVLIYA
jgi:prophage DNA circulation protein